MVDVPSSLPDPTGPSAACEWHIEPQVIVPVPAPACATDFGPMTVGGGLDAVGPPTIWPVPSWAQYGNCCKFDVNWAHTNVSNWFRVVYVVECPGSAPAVTLVEESRGLVLPQTNTFVVPCGCTGKVLFGSRAPVGGANRFLTCVAVVAICSKTAC